MKITNPFEQRQINLGSKWHRETGLEIIIATPVPPIYNPIFDG